jgi:(2S)-methylsuccinyl-CoA dehydrogenase
MHTDPTLTLPALAAALLQRVRGPFETATRTLAQACAVGGRLDAARLDHQQVDCYELAWVSADLLAAETALAALGPGSAAVDRQLALVFAVEAITASLNRLELLYLELGLDLAPLQAVATSADWARLRQAGGGAQALAAAGQAVVDAQGQIAAVPLNETLMLAQQSFRRVAAEVVAPAAAAIHRDDLTVPESVLQPLRDMGVFGLSVPQRYGGIAPDDHDDTVMMVVVTEALSEASLGAAGSLITRPEILSRALLAGGTEAQKQHWLPLIAAGDPLCAIAITEPDHGSDVAGLTFRGTRVPGGWQLDGAKTWCTFAGKAGLLMVVTRTDPDRSIGHRGLSLMLVDKPPTEGHAFDHQQSGGGRLRGRAIPTIGYRGMHSFELSFERWFVPDAQVIGEAAGLGKGFYFTMTGMVGGRMQTAARSCGVMWAALHAALAYTADRKVFGAALQTYPLTLAKLARMAARLAACRQLTYAIARVMDGGGGRVEASLVKLLACRSAEWVTREALQLHGGMGYAEETPVSRYFVDARVLSIFEGAEETLALKVVARGLLEDALATA